MTASKDTIGMPSLADLGIRFGGDYNPEQWPRELWREDADLMVRAGVNLVTVGVFSWATIEPSPGVRRFEWLDEVLEVLHERGIGVDLATPTASPPPWLGLRHPETLPTDADGVRLVAGSRNQFSPASRIYRDHALAITRDLADRYAGHPAVKMWHIGNEFGQIDFGDESADAFRQWLQDRYGTVDALNDAWGTAVWSQRYGSFDEVVPPRRRPYLVNPGQSLDFRRYSSDQLLRCYREQRDAVRDAGAEQPITTNFMGFSALVDYRSWVGEVDVIADDQYPDPGSPEAPVEIALVQDLMRSLGGGRPWMLMEQAASATSWRSHNLPKSPAKARLDSLQAVARGADAVCFFQWRQSSAGAERFHSAMIPHAGPDTEVFRGVCRLGEDLRRLRSVVGTGIRSDVAIVFDWPSWWAAEEPARPTDRLHTMDQLSRWYRLLWRRGIAVDVVAPDADLSPYAVVLMPHSYIVEPGTAAALAEAVERGASAVVGPFSGVADSYGRIVQGRSPALLRDLLGVSGEEWAALPDDPVPLAIGTAWQSPPSRPVFAEILGERLRSDGAEVLARFAAGDLAGSPAITRRRTGGGRSWYVGAVVSDDALDAVLADALDSAGVTGVLGGALPLGLEAVQRGSTLFLLNHGAEPAAVTLPADGMHDLLSGEILGRSVAIPPGDAMVLTERREA